MADLHQQLLEKLLKSSNLEKNGKFQKIANTMGLVAQVYF